MPTPPSASTTRIAYCRINTSSPRWTSLYSSWAEPDLYLTLFIDPTFTRTDEGIEPAYQLHIDSLRQANRDRLLDVLEKKSGIPRLILRVLPILIPLRDLEGEPTPRPIEITRRTK